MDRTADFFHIQIKLIRGVGACARIRAPTYPRRIVSSLLQHMRTPTLPLAHDVLCPPAFAQPCPSILRSRGLHTLSAGKTLPQSRFFRFQHKHIIVQKIDLCQWTGGVKVFHRLYKYHINILWLV